MSKSNTKRAPVERRKHPRRSRAASKAEPRAQLIDECIHCGKGLKKDDRALFVEEELCRTFCTESCIADYFAADIRRLEREYHKHLPAGDLSGEEREKHAHLRWVTLENPDEVWREKTLAGDYRYTLISEYQPDSSKKIWMVCICLFLRGEPSFLYIAFPTSSEGLVDYYRKGERVPPGALKKGSQEKGKAGKESAPTSGGEPLMDGLADGWTEEESFRAQLIQKRSENDIPPSEFELYQGCIEETLEAPDEVWALDMTDDGRVVGAGAAPSPEEEDLDAVETTRVYHFIRRYAQDPPEMWYVIVARETEDEDQIELLDAFPTRDPELVARHRRGTQEIGGRDQAQASRMVH
jgi:hypothetical protein